MIEDFGDFEQDEIKEQKTKFQIKKNSIFGRFSMKAAAMMKYKRNLQQYYQNDPFDISSQQTSSRSTQNSSRAKSFVQKYHDKLMKSKQTKQAFDPTVNNLVPNKKIDDPNYIKNLADKMLENYKKSQFSSINKSKNMQIIKGKTYYVKFGEISFQKGYYNGPEWPMENGGRCQSQQIQSRYKDIKYQRPQSEYIQFRGRSGHNIVIFNIKQPNFDQQRDQHNYSLENSVYDPAPLFITNFSEFNTDRQSLQQRTNRQYQSINKTASVQMQQYNQSINENDKNKLKNLLQTCKQSIKRKSYMDQDKNDKKYSISMENSPCQKMNNFLNLSTLKQNDQDSEAEFTNENSPRELKMDKDQQEEIVQDFRDNFASYAYEIRKQQDHIDKILSKHPQKHQVQMRKKRKKINL